MITGIIITNIFWAFTESDCLHRLYHLIIQLQPYGICTDYSWGNRSLERLNNLPKVTPVLSGMAGIWNPQKITENIYWALYAKQDTELSILLI